MKTDKDNPGGINQNGKVSHEQRLDAPQLRGRGRKWCLCGQRIGHERVCWVRRTKVEYLRERKAEMRASLRGSHEPALVAERKRLAGRRDTG